METSVEVRYCLIFYQKSTKKFAFANLGIFEKNLNLLCIKNSDIKLAPNSRPKRNSIEAKIPAGAARTKVCPFMSTARARRARIHARATSTAFIGISLPRTLWLQSPQSFCHDSSLYF